MKTNISGKQIFRAVKPMNKKIVHMGFTCFVLGTATFSWVLTSCLVLIWIGGSFYRYVFQPISQIDVDFQAKDELTAGVYRELWP